MLSAEEWESIQETLFWQSQTGLLSDVVHARQEYEAGQTMSGDEMRRRYRLHD